MIRNLNGKSQLSTISIEVDKLSKTIDELKQKAAEENLALISWIRCWGESLRRNIDCNSSTGCAKPPAYKKHKLSPVHEDESLHAKHRFAPPSPSQVLPEEEIDRVNNLRVRDLQKELKNENADFKLKWNKQQLRNCYLEILVEKYQRNPTQPKSDVPEITQQVPVFSQVTEGESLDRKIRVIQENQSDECSVMRVSDSPVDLEESFIECNGQTNEDKGEYESSKKPNASIIMADCDNSFSPKPIEENLMEICETSLRRDSMVATSMLCSFDNENEPTVDRMSYQMTDNGNEFKELSKGSSNQTTEKKETHLTEQKQTQDEPKIKITEVKKGMVANVKAAYMEAVESKKTEFKTLSPASARKQDNRLRSPLKTIVQSSVQSAKRLLSPGSKGIISSPQQSNNMVTTKDQEILQIADNDRQCTKKMMDQPLSVTGGSSALKAISTGSSSNGSHSSGFKSDGGKAAIEARMARIAEMRNKSQATKTRQVPTAETSTKSHLVSKLAGTSHIAAGIEKSNIQKITAQMRAKHFGITQSAPHIASQGIVGNNAGPLVALISTESIRSNGVMPMSSVMKTIPTFQTCLVESVPENNYEISDTEESDDESDCESEYSASKKKMLPSWAQKKELIAALENQFAQDEYCYIDPDDLFGEVESCDLKEIFGSPKRKNSKYQRRASTGNWTNDRVTAAEKLAYKRDHRMKFVKQY